MEEQHPSALWLEFLFFWGWGGTEGRKRQRGGELIPGVQGLYMLDCRITVHVIMETDHKFYQQGHCSSGRSQVHTTLQDLVEGKTKSTFPRVVDVRDVARAHILAAETPEASGRFLVSWETTISGKFALDVLREAFPHYDFPEGEDVPSKKEISCDKVKLPLSQTFSPC